MAKIVGKKLQWTNSTSSDVVATRIYVCLATETMDYAKSNVTVNVPMAEYVLPGAFTIMTADTSYKVSITSVDDGGNESDQSPVGGLVFPLDPIAPLAPSGLKVVDL